MAERLLKPVMAIFFALAGLMAGATPRVTLGEVVGTAGETVTVEVSLDSDAPLGGLQLLFDAPDGITVGQAETAGRADAFAAGAGIRDGRASVMLFSTSGATIAAGSGVVARFGITFGSNPLDAAAAVTVKAVDAAGNAVEAVGADIRLRCLQPCAEYASRAIDFGRVPLGTGPVRTVTLSNSGTAPLVVEGVTFSDATFSSPTAFPLTVAPGATAPVEVTFTPAERGNVSATMKVECNSRQTYNSVRLAAAPYAVNEMHIGRAVGTAGEEVTIALDMNNMDAVNGFTMEFELPEALRYVAGSFALSDRADGHAVQVNCIGNRLVANAYSLENKPFRGADGTVATFRVLLKGKYSHTVSLKKCVLSAFYRGNILNVTSDTYAGMVEIRYPSISLASSISVGRTPITETGRTTLTVNNYGSAPLTIGRVTSDNEHVAVATALPLTVGPWERAEIALELATDYRGDIAGRLNVYSNDPEQEMVAVPFTGNRYSPNELIVGVGKNAESGNITVALANNDAAGGIQFDVSPAWGTVLGEAVAVGRMEGFTVTHRTLANGDERYFVYSLDGAYAARGSGAVVTIPFTTDADATRAFTVANVRISTPDMQNVASSTTSTPFLIGDVNSNGEVNVVDITAVAQYISRDVVNGFSTIPADVNFDGHINVADITNMAKILSKK